MVVSNVIFQADGMYQESVRKNALKKPKMLKSRGECACDCPIEFSLTKYETHSRQGRLSKEQRGTYPSLSMPKHPRISHAIQSLDDNVSSVSTLFDFVRGPNTLSLDIYFRLASLRDGSVYGHA